MENIERNLESRGFSLEEYSLFGMEIKEHKVKAEFPEK